MRVRSKRLAALFFAFCLAFTLLVFVPAPASADNVQIQNVLASLNYAPVIYMELQYVNVSTSASGCTITGVSWIDATGKVETAQFGRGTYRLEISYAAQEGYAFAADAKGFINNDSSGVSVTVSADGSTAVLSKTYQAEIWAPVAIKDPGNAVIEVDGWTSFVVSSMYTDTDEWYMVDPDGKTYTVKQAAAMLPPLTYSGESTDRLVLQNIPADADGWSVFCRHWSVDKISYSDSKRGSITVTGITPTPEPTPTRAPATPIPTPEETSPATPAPTVTATPSPVVFKPEWSSDAVYHWHDSEDGSAVSGKAEHSLVWRETTAATASADGEEEGVCSICGYTVSRVLPATGEQSGGSLNLGRFRLVLGLIAAAIILGILAMLLSAIFAPKKKKRR